MKWSEMSVFHKIMVVVGLLCGFTSLVLKILQHSNVLENAYANAISHALWGVFCFASGVKNTSTVIRVLWYILAALCFFLCLLYLL